MLLPVAALPNVDFPTIMVTAQLPGASPDTMASSVATPLEQQFAAIPGLDQMSSTSGLGTTLITLQFDLSRNIDGAAEDVQTAINAASGLLPKSMPSPPTFKKTNPADRAILIYAVSSDAMPVQDLDQYAYNVLAEAISRVNGVSQVNIAGEQIPAVHVQINPDAIASRGISLEDVRNALVNATTDLPKGISRVTARSTPSAPMTSCSTPVPSVTSSPPIATARRWRSRTSAMSSTRRSLRAPALGTTRSASSCC
jgi:multidrug efflux pump subunit AcrB